jgi:hypothetical protein
MQDTISNNLIQGIEEKKKIPRISWFENIILFFFLFAMYLLGGYFIKFFRGYLPVDAVSRMLNAWLVTHGTVSSLSSIGFVWPPIPTLLLVPVSIIPSLYQNWMAVVVLSAISMAGACVMIGLIANICGLSPLWRRIIVILFAINPLMVVFGINGMSEAILVFATLTASYWLIRFWQTGRNTVLILTGGFFSLLPLIRYEFAIITAWSGLLILFLIIKNRDRFTLKKFTEYVEGILLAYASLVIYPFFLWMIASWLIMGNPFYFLFNDRSATNVAEFQINDFGIITVCRQTLWDIDPYSK